MQSKELIAGIVAKINGGTYDNPALEQKLSQLAEKLSKTSGKKVYGYLKADVRSVVRICSADLLPRATAMPVIALEKFCWTAVCCLRISKKRFGYCKPPLKRDSPMPNISSASCSIKES